MNVNVLLRRPSGQPINTFGFPQCRHAIMVRKKSMRSQIESIVGEGIYDSLDIVPAIFEGTFNLALEFSTFFQAFLMLFGIGELIIWFRVAVVDAGDIAYFFAIAIAIAFSAVEVILNAIFAVINFFSGHHRKHIPPLHPSKMWGPWLKEVRDIPTECAKYTDWQEVTGFFLGQLTKNNVCVFLRYIEPVPWLYRFFDGILGWMTLDPNPDGGNCTTEEIDWLCAILGIGFVIISLLIPILLAAIIIKSYKPVIVMVLSWTWHIAEFLVHLVVFRLFRGAIQGFEDIAHEWETFNLQKLLRKHHTK